MGCSFSRIVFQPPTPRQQGPSSTLCLKTSDGNTIPVKFFNLGREYTILMSHGNAEDIYRMEEWIYRTFLQKVNVNVMLYEYSGYAGTHAQPSEKFVYSDCEAALWFLTEVMRIPLKKIILYGRSLGSGPSCYLAEKYPNIGGLILQTPLNSVYRVIIDFRFTLPGDMFPNIDRIKRVKCPLLIIHGTRDEIVPITHAQDLYRAAGSAVKFELYVEGAGHNNIESVSGPVLFGTLQQFIDAISL